MKKENKVLLKVLVEKKQKEFIRKEAKFFRCSEAELVRDLIEYCRGVKRDLIKR